MSNTAQNETASTEAPRRGRGRPTSKMALRLQNELRTKGRVGMKFGEAPLPSEATVRMRLYAAGRAVGIPVRVSITGSGIGRRLEATPRVNDAPDEAEAEAEATETTEA